jgi:hypothetical protein
VKLLRKLKRSVNPEKWEKAIVKFCYYYGGTDDAFEVERYGYLHSSHGAKLRIIKNLLEGQFDVNAKFKNLINATIFVWSLLGKIKTGTCTTVSLTSEQTSKSTKRISTKRAGPLWPQTGTN